MENKQPKLNKTILTPEQRDKLELWQQAHDQLKTLDDIANITQEIVRLFDEQKVTGEESSKEMGACLMDMRDSLNELKEKESPESPDFSSPIIKAIEKLEKSLGNEINNLDVKPNITVDSPQVNVSPPSVDLKRIEKILKTDIPKAFQEAMMMMPMPEKEDNSELMKMWEGISEQLQSIENATRMKPLPGSMVVSNLPITNDKVDVNATVTATVDTTGLATDTIQTNGTQKSQLVDAGGEAATVTGGKLDVNASVDTTGLALAANQQTDALTNTQLRATAVPVSGTFYQATQPVSGTVTANLSATDNTVLDTIASSLAGTLTVTGGGGGVEYTEGDIDATIVGSAMMVEDAANTLQPAQGDKTNGLDVDVTRSALPTGAATSALQLADNHQVTVSNIASTPLVNITTLATSAKQLADGHSVALSATDNAVLDTIDSNTDSGAVVGVGAAATAQRVHLADEDLTALENITVISSGTVTANAGTNLNTSTLALETGGNLASVKTNTDKIPALGQALAASSVPVILPTATITTLTPPAAITGFSTETTLGTVHGHVDSIDTKTPALGQALAAASVPVILPTATITTLTPPSAITGFATAAKQLADGHTVALSATDNAVLDVIAAKDFATQTTLAAVNAKMVTGTDIGDVTINNSTGAAAVNIQDGGNTLTVDGTVAVTNADMATVAGAVAATHMQVDVLTAPSTAVTNAGITTIAGAVAGTEMQVDVLTMPTVTVNAHAVTNAGTFAVQTTSAITGIGHGVKVVTTAGTDVALAGSTACKRVIIQAQTDNTSLIAVGGSGVDATIATGTGIVLNPGDAFEMEIDNLIDIYIDSLVNGEGCRFTYWT